MDYMSFLGGGAGGAGSLAGMGGMMGGAGGGGGYSAESSSEAKTGDQKVNSMFGTGAFAVGSGAKNGMDVKTIAIVGGVALLGLIIWKKF